MPGCNYLVEFRAHRNPAPNNRIDSILSLPAPLYPIIDTLVWPHARLSGWPPAS